MPFHLNCQQSFPTINKPKKKNRITKKKGFVQNKLYEEIGYRDVKSFRYILYLPILLFSNFISDYSRLIFISDKFRENLVSRGEYFFTSIVRIIFSSFKEISSRLLYWTKEHFRVSR